MEICAFGKIRAGKASQRKNNKSDQQSQIFQIIHSIFICELNRIPLQIHIFMTVKLGTGDRQERNGNGEDNMALTVGYIINNYNKSHSKSTNLRSLSGQCVLLR